MAPEPDPAVRRDQDQAHQANWNTDPEASHAPNVGEETSENTPLLSRSTESPHNNQSQPRRSPSADSLSAGEHSWKSGRRRWPSVLALLLLCIVVILIIVFAFVAPSIVEQYAAEAVVFEPSSLSIDSFTKTGVRARIQGDFYLDASRTRSKTVHDLGIFGTWIAGEVESGKSEVEVSLPEYGNVLLGTAHVPGVKVDVRNGRRTHVDIFSELVPGDKEGIRQVANDWIDGRIGNLRVVGTAKVPLKSGIFSLGTQDFRHELVLSGDDVPSIPAYDMQKLVIREIGQDGGQGMEADVALAIKNDYPVDLDLPSFGFEVFVDNCAKNDPHIQVARALTSKVHISPNKHFQVNVTGFVHKLPHEFIQSCPGSETSPLDNFITRYMRGNDSTIYVRGAKQQAPHTPGWIGDFISDITVPVPLPGRSFGHLIKNFTLEETHFGLPDPFAEPDTPESNPQISAIVRAVVALPQEMNFNLDARRVRATADVFYKGSKLGNLDLSKWQNATSTRIDGDDDDEGPTLLVASRVENAPLRIADDDLFADVIQDLLFGRKSVLMHIKADVDVEVNTALGEFKVRGIPAEGEVPVQPVSSHLPTTGNGALHLAVGDLRILDTTASSLRLGASINLTNPTPYSASVPFVDIQICKNGSVLGHASARDLTLTAGNNSNLAVQAVYAPLDFDGPVARDIGRNLLSQYLSGYNTTITLRTHNGTFPSKPGLGAALSRFELSMPIPHLKAPQRPRPSDPDDGGDDDGDTPQDPEDDDEQTHFIRHATFHLFGSTATFELFSPLQHTTIVIEHLNATALYPHRIPRGDQGDGGDDNDDDDDWWPTSNNQPATNSHNNNHAHDHGDDNDDDDDDKGPIQEDPVGTIVYDRPFTVPPVDRDGNGVATPRLPVTWSLGGVGYGAVKKALGGTLKLSAFANVRVRIGAWREDIWFRGRGIGTRIRFA